MKSLATFVAIAVLVPALARARSNTPPTQRVDLCDPPQTSQTCFDGCHNQPGVASDLQPLDPSLGRPLALGTTPPGPLPATYTPGQTYTLLIQVVENNAAARCLGQGVGCGATIPARGCAFGFELAAVVDGSCASPTPTQAGTFNNPFPGVGIVNTAGIDYVKHDQCSVAPNPATTNEKAWALDWTAPPAGTGRVTFFYVVNSADASFDNTGDAIHTFTASMDEGVPGGLTVDKSVNPTSVQVGQTAQFRITVNNTGLGDLTCSLNDNVNQNGCMSLVDSSCTANPPIPGLNCAGGSVRGMGIAIPASGTQTIDFTVTADVAGACDNTVGVQCTGGSMGQDTGTLQITQVGQACDLNCGAVPSLGPPLDKNALFSDTTTCAPKRIPALPEEAMFSQTGSADLDPSDPTLACPLTNPLVVWEVVCPCGGDLKAVKLPGGGVHLEL